MYYGSWKLNDLLTFVCNTHTPSTGAATDADANPGYAVFEDETTAPIITGSMAKLGDAHTLGFYSEQLTLSAANGLEKGKSYNIYISATVGGIVGTTSHNFQMEAEVDANTVSVPVTAGMVTGSVLGDVNGSVGSVVNPVGISTGTFLEAIADTVWDELLSGHLTPGSAGHILFSRMPTGTVLVGDKTGFSLSSPQTVDINGTITNVTNVINPVVAGVVTGSVLGNVNGSVGSVVSPVGINTGTFLSALADAVWDEQISGHLTAGSVGNALNAAGAAGDPWSTALPGAYVAGQAGHILASRMPTGTVIVGQNNDKTGYSLSSPQSFDLIGNISGTMSNVINVLNPVVAGVVTGSVLGNVNGSVGSVTQPVGISTGTFLDALADKVWDEPIAGHLAAGSVGNALNAAGSAGDPWSTSLPGSYVVGQAGHILASRMPTGTVLVGDKTGFSLASPQVFDLIGNISGTITNTLNVVNPVVAGVVTGSVLGNVNGSVGSVTTPVGISTGSFINAIADQVWDEQLSAHLSAGSAGSALNGAGSAGDPWTTPLPGAYGAGTAGHILASRMPTGTVIVGTNNDKTGYSLSSPQNINIVGNISGTFVGNLSGSVGSVTDMGSTLLNKMADFILRRPLASARASSDGDAVTFRSLLGGVSKLVNRWKISGTTLTVYTEDDTATAGTQALTGTAGADPITEVDTNG